MTRRLVAAATTALVLLICVGSTPGETHSSGAPGATHRGGATVTAAGGTYPLDGLTVTAEPDTVTRDTSLTMRFAGRHQRLSGLFDGLNVSSIAFDLSLAGGAQPRKPLKIDIPLTGRFLPSGARPADAVLYSRTADGKAFVVAPGEVDTDGVLHAEIDHLSEKAVTYITTDDIDRWVASGAISVLPVSDCPQTMKAGATELKVTGIDQTKRMSAAWKRSAVPRW